MLEYRHSTKSLPPISESELRVLSCVECLILKEILSIFVWVISLYFRYIYILEPLIYISITISIKISLQLRHIALTCLLHYSQTCWTSTQLAGNEKKY